MKAIILAAGKGRRFGKYTNNRPKCLIEFDGVSLLERQIQTYKKAGINDIHIHIDHIMIRDRGSVSKANTTKNEFAFDGIIAKRFKFIGFLCKCFGTKKHKKDND